MPRPPAVDDDVGKKPAFETRPRPEGTTVAGFRTPTAVLVGDGATEHGTSCPISASAEIRASSRPLLDEWQWAGGGRRSPQAARGGAEAEGNDDVSVTSVSRGCWHLLLRLSGASGAVDDLTVKARTGREVGLDTGNSRGRNGEVSAVIKENH